jgi:hypothetical protein
VVRLYLMPNWVMGDEAQREYECVRIRLEGVFCLVTKQHGNTVPLFGSSITSISCLVYRLVRGSPQRLCLSQVTGAITACFE